MADDAAQNSARDLTSPHSNPVQGGISISAAMLA